MSKGVSMAHARRVAKGAPDSCTISARIDPDGRLDTFLEVDVRQARLRPGKKQEMRALLYEVGSIEEGGTPRPLPTPDGRHALALPVSVKVPEGKESLLVRVGADVEGHADEWVEVALERAVRSKAPTAIAAALAAATLAATALGSLGDPLARKGHYEGKTKEEIQADLDADVAWYEMEISVASRATMAEGSISLEARIENVEANHCDQKVRIWEAGNEDDVLYESGAIAPGEYLQHVELAHPLPVGTHTLTVQFQGYEQSPTLLSNEGTLLGHDTFGASCAAEVEVEVVPAAN